VGWAAIILGVIALVTYIVLSFSEPLQTTELIGSTFRVLGLFALTGSLLIRSRRPQLANWLFGTTVLVMLVNLVLPIVQEVEVIVVRFGRSKTVHNDEPANKTLQATPVHVAKTHVDFMVVPRSRRGAGVVGRA
jgi:hypothetical protein